MQLLSRQGVRNPRHERLSRLVKLHVPSGLSVTTHRRAVRNGFVVILVGAGAFGGGALGVGPALLASPAEASLHHAHWHYMVGARTGAARSFCKQLHHEAISPGPLHLELARTNGVDIGRLADEIAHWVDATEAVNSADENARIRDDLRTMRTTSAELSSLASELVAWIDEALASGPAVLVDDNGGPNDADGAEGTAGPGGGGAADGTVSPSAAALRTRIADRSAALFHGFGRVLRAHKSAEQTLGIPVPNDPPPID